MIREEIESAWELWVGVILERGEEPTLQTYLSFRTRVLEVLRAMEADVLSPGELLEVGPLNCLRRECRLASLVERVKRRRRSVHGDGDTVRK
jgi:hypothetical protein